MPHAGRSKGGKHIRCYLEVYKQLHLPMHHQMMNDSSNNIYERDLWDRLNGWDFIYGTSSEQGWLDESDEARHPHLRIDISRY